MSARPLLVDLRRWAREPKPCLPDCPHCAADVSYAEDQADEGHRKVAGMVGLGVWRTINL